MNILFSLFTILIIIIIAVLGVEAANFKYLFGVIFPYAAIAIFLLGIIIQVIKWARSPVPFRIPTVAGQQKSLNWIKSSKLESPHTTLGVIGRMILEILLFRSLFRNTKAEIVYMHRQVIRLDDTVSEFSLNPILAYLRPPCSK